MFYSSPEIQKYPEMYKDTFQIILVYREIHHSPAGKEVTILWYDCSHVDNLWTANFL